MKTELLAIRGDFSAEACESVIRTASRASSPLARRRLFYPYFWLQLRYKVGTWLGKSALRVECLVDARTQVSSTSDPFELEPVEADEAEVVAPRVDVAEALRLAERYASYVVKNRRKALVTPKMEVLDQRLVYKTFWIVDCAEAYTLLVDGVTSGFHPLNR